MSARHPPTHLLTNQGPPFRLVAFRLLSLAKSPQRARDSARALALTVLAHGLRLDASLNVGGAGETTGVGGLGFDIRLSRSWPWGLAGPVLT